MRNISELPGSYGLPLIGEAHEAFIYKQQFYLDRYHKYKSCFKTKILDTNAVVVFGNNACNTFLNDREGIFLSRKGWGLLEEFLGYGLLLQDGDEHKVSRKLVGSAFTELSNETIFQTILNSSNKTLEYWDRKKQVYLYREIKKLTFEIIFILVFGPNKPIREVEYLEKQFSYLSDGQLDISRIKIPQTAYGRALSARKSIFEYVLNKVNLAIKINQYGDFILGSILNKNNKEYISSPLNPEEITVQVIQVLFAGHETSATLIYWTIFSLYKHPKILKSIRNYTYNFEYKSQVFFRSCETLDYCLLETERLFPPVYAIPRGLSKDFCFDGYMIPKSWNIFISPLITHRLDSIFSNPNQFFPNRFKNKNLSKQIFGFGGGKHRCLGKEIAKLEARILLLLLIKNYNFSISPNLSFNQAILNSNSYLKSLFMKLQKH